MPTTATDPQPAMSFDELYAGVRGDLFRALATITDDRDLSTEAVDVGFTRWRRKLRRARHVPAAVGVMALAYKWAARQMRRSGQFHGFRLDGTVSGADTATIERLQRLTPDERALLVMSHVLGWNDEHISHALDADGTAVATRAITEKLATEGYRDEVVAEVLRHKAASFSEPLSRLDTVKTKGAIQRVGALVGGAAVTLVIVGGVVALVDSIGSTGSEGLAATTGSVPGAAGGRLTAENAVWQRLSPPVSGDNISALAHDGTDFYLLATDNQGRPAMMKSSNGADWVQIPAPAVGQNMWFQQIVATPDVLMAVGNGFDNVRGRESTAVFTSTDDGNWTRADLPMEDQVEIGGQTFDIYTYVQTANVTEAGFTIVGGQGAEFDPQFLLRDIVDPELMRNGYGTSPTGMQFFDNEGNMTLSMTWEELGLAPEIGTLIGGGRSIIWTSSDGVDWEVATIGMPAAAQGVGGYAVLGDLEAIMAWGGGGLGGPAVWVRKGEDWERPDLDASLSAMTSWNDRLFVAGRDTQTGESGIWATTDGTTWEQTSVPVGGVQQFFSSPAGLVAVGWQDSIAALGPASIEVDDLTVLVHSDGRLQVTDADGELIVEVYGDESLEASVIEIEDPETGEALVEVERAAIERAWEQLSRDVEFSGQNGSPAISVLVSEDGRSWEALEPEDPNFYPQSIAFGNGSLLLLGWSEGENFLGFGSGQHLILVTAE